MKISPWKHQASFCEYGRTFFVNPLNRSSRPVVFCEKGVLKNFAKFIEKQLCHSLFLIKLQTETCNFIKKETLAQVFSCEFCEISKNSFFHRTPLVAASIYFKESFLWFGLQTRCFKSLLNTQILTQLVWKASVREHMLQNKRVRVFDFTFLWNFP